MENEFQVIETQEQLNNVIKDRLARERAKFSDYDDIKAKCADYELRLGSAIGDSEAAQAKLAELEKAIAEKDSEIARMATESLKTGIALQYGLPLEMASRLNGTTEDELKADAEMFASMLASRSGSVTPPPPLRNTESVVEEDGVLAAFLKMNPNISIK